MARVGSRQDLTLCRGAVDLEAYLSYGLDLQLFQNANGSSSDEALHQQGLQQRGAAAAAASAVSAVYQKYKSGGRARRGGRLR